MDLISVQECPICKSSSFQDILVCKDHTVSKEQFTIQSCLSCGLYLTNPRPTSERLAAYYQSHDYISHSGGSMKLFDQVYRYARTGTLKWKHRLISDIQKKGSILDFGCGTGEFLNQMKSKGWEVTGVEPSDQARTRASQLLSSSQSLYSSLDELPNKQFDVISLWHVLEHVEQLNQTIAIIKKRLRPGGAIFVAVPNHESHDAHHYGKYWAGYDVPRHLWHFSKDNMKQLLMNHKLHLQKIMPMKLDAYYVSLLSEKYKSANGTLSNSIKSFYQATISNQKGNAKINHSSLIYVVRHA